MHKLAAIFTNLMCTGILVYEAINTILTYVRKTNLRLSNLSLFIQIVQIIDNDVRAQL